MARRSVGDVLDQIVAYQYEGAPSVTAADVIDLAAQINERAFRYYRRPRIASFRFSPFLRTPVHDLPYDGVGVVAMHRDEWHRLLREYQDELPSEMNLISLFGVAVEEW